MLGLAMTRRSVLVLLAFVAFISLGLPEGLLGVSWPSIRNTFALPLDGLGLLVSATTIGYLGSSFLAGRLLRAMSIGALLALSTAASAVALLGFAFAPIWPAMLVAALLAGSGGGAVDAGLNAYGATHFSARILNWLHAFFGVGTTIGPLVVTAVLESGRVWRWSYGLMGGLMLALALLFYLTRRRWNQVSEIDAPATPATVVVAAASGDTLRRPAVWLGMLTFFFYTGTELIAAQWSYSLFTLGRGVPEARAGLAVSLYWGSLTAGRVLFGAIAEHVPLVRALRLCLLGSIAGALAVWLAPSPVFGFAGLMLIGVCFAPVFATLIRLTPARVGAAHADNAIGFQIASAALGGASLTALVGVVADALGLEAIGVAFVVCTVVLFGHFEVLVRANPSSADDAPAVSREP
ncbi:major facilitator superfamily MFS_1 [Haliangium ochraceum DSM 14365]|uniref:Major facilitator superfamily MFS_1 n=2 Tax=Haliangium ochraceum TaxID=80816 RepID=D0LTF6_HALO1|nr:major facilitator superfamily MFS_1 [Haliangium ochraceum DSM 14365]